MRSGDRLRLSWLTALGLVCCLGVSCQNLPTAPSPPPAPDTAWRSLYDGDGIKGWLMVGAGRFREEEGALVAEGGLGLLWYSPEKFSNCQVRVVFKLSSPNDNSGVLIRIPTPPVDPWQAIHQGYEVQIENTGDLYHRLGCLNSFTKARNVVAASVDEWSTMIITLDGERTLVEVNGLLIADYLEGDLVPPKKEWYEPDRGPRSSAGYIGLQNHDDNSHVRFREVSVRPL